jgi:protein-disulfide isomerase
MNAFADACPRCFPGDSPASIPANVNAEANGVITANYCCPACGQPWQTRWEVATAWPLSRDTRTVPELMDSLIRLLAGLHEMERTK